ncbi:MAG TPA: amidohydrolase [Streptosporangiaceae bacterium]|nr:amidohydrolase [Streptosporangiaceae bacterium]
MTTPRDAIRAAVESRHAQAIALSHRIHASPELGFAERMASSLIAAELTACGLDVTLGVCDLPTALTATAGSGPLTIAICAEYDALPEIGHACGHNIIAASACLAAAALAPIADDLGIALRVLGTPAEEAGGGKVLMLQRGAFGGVHAALMAHPAARDCFEPFYPASSPLIVSYRGQAAHAAAWPERGINAADAITVAQVGIGLLRQHILGTDRIHGYVSRGGSAANIVPDHTELTLTVRSATLDGLQSLLPRVEACLRAGAMATGCSADIRQAAPVYAHMRHDAELAAAFAANARMLGHAPPVQEGPERAAGSTDMGNVSQVIPAIHPLMKIDSAGAVNHQPGFAAACAGPDADRLVADAALALAWTIADVATDPEHRARLLAGEASSAEPH